MEKLDMQFLDTHITSKEGASEEEAGRTWKEKGCKDRNKETERVGLYAPLSAWISVKGQVGKHGAATQKQRSP